MIDEESSDVINQLIAIIQITSDDSIDQIQSIESETLERLSGLPVIENHVVIFGDKAT